MGIKAIFFDLDDTLFQYKAANAKVKAELKAVEYFCRKHSKFKLADTFDVFTKIKTGIKKRFPDLPVRDDRGYWIVEFLRAEHQFDGKLAREILDEFWKHSLENVDGFYDAEVLLKYLKKKGYKLGVITNGIRKWQLKRLRATGFYKYFDHLTSTSEVGFAKPDHAVYKLALKKAGVRASQAVMIGDNPHKDILPANQLGMKTVWLRRGKRYYYPVIGKEKADYKIKNFVELMSVF